MDTQEKQRHKKNEERVKGKDKYREVQAEKGTTHRKAAAVSWTKTNRTNTEREKVNRARDG